MIRFSFKKVPSGITLFKGKLYISVFSMAAICLLLYADFSVYTLIIALSIVIHEFSHVFVLKLCKGTIKRINVYPFGIDIISNMNTLTYTKELATVLAGSAANLTASLLAFVILGTSQSVAVCFFIYVNLVLGIGNLIPLPVFDGGRALHLIIKQSVPVDKVYYVEKGADRLAFALFFLFSLHLFFFTRYNLSAVICICYVALSAVLYEKLVCNTRQISGL